MGEPTLLDDILSNLGTIAASIAGAFLAIDKTKNAIMRLSNTKPMLRKSIRADIELFRIMEVMDPGYNELKNHIKKQVEIMIKEAHKKEIITKNWAQILIGLCMAGGFGYWTYYIIKEPPSNWWIILTIWGALAGLGFLSSGYEKSSPNKANSAEKSRTAD